MLINSQRNSTVNLLERFTSCRCELTIAEERLLARNNQMRSNNNTRHRQNNGQVIHQKALKWRAANLCLASSQPCAFAAVKGEAFIRTFRGNRGTLIAPKQLLQKGAVQSERHFVIERRIVRITQSE